MNKYDKMLELNKKKSEEKVTSAVNTIREMVVEKEKVSIPKLGCPEDSFIKIRLSEVKLIVH